MTRAAMLAGISEIDLVLYLASTRGGRASIDLVSFLDELSAGRPDVVDDAHAVTQWLLAEGRQPLGGRSVEQALVVLSDVRRRRARRAAGYT